MRTKQPELSWEVTFGEEDIGAGSDAVENPLAIAHYVY